MLSLPPSVPLLLWWVRAEEKAREGDSRISGEEAVREEAGMATGSVDLEEVPSVDLMTELLRRMKCATKPDKRLILIGTDLPESERLAAACACFWSSGSD